MTDQGEKLAFVHFQVHIFNGAGLKGTAGLISVTYMFQFQQHSFFTSRTISSQVRMFSGS